MAAKSPISQNHPHRGVEERLGLATTEVFDLSTATPTMTYVVAPPLPPRLPASASSTSDDALFLPLAGASASSTAMPPDLSSLRPKCEIVTSVAEAAQGMGSSSGSSTAVTPSDLGGGRRGGFDASLPPPPASDDDVTAARSSGITSTTMALRSSPRSVCILPSEVLAAAASYLPLRSLLDLTLVSKHTSKAIIAHDRLLWKPHVLSLWSEKIWFQGLLDRALNDSASMPPLDSTTNGMATTKKWHNAAEFLVAAAESIETTVADPFKPTLATLSPALSARIPAVAPLVEQPHHVALFGATVKITFRALLIASHKLGRTAGITAAELRALNWTISYHTDPPAPGTATTTTAAAQPVMPPAAGGDRTVVFEPSAVPGSLRLRSAEWHEPLPCQLTQGGKALHVSVFPSLVVTRRPSDWAWVIRNYFVRMEASLNESETTLRLLRRFLLPVPQRPP